MIPDLAQLERMRPDTVVGVPAGELAAIDKASTSLAEQQARYLAVRQHTLSTTGLDGAELWRAEAAYVHGEAEELRDAVEALAALGEQPADDVTDDVWHTAQRGVRHEIADVVLAATTLAGMPPGCVTVEDCIAEKTEADRGRG